MPEISTYSFPLREVAEILLKSANIKKGKWIIGANISFSIGTMGPTPPEAKPGVMALIEGINLTKVEDNSESVGLIIDASQI